MNGCVLCDEFRFGLHYHLGEQGVFCGEGDDEKIKRDAGFLNVTEVRVPLPDGSFRIVEVAPRVRA